MIKHQKQIILFPTNTMSIMSEKLLLVMVQQLNMYMMETTSQKPFLIMEKVVMTMKDIFTNTNTMMMALYQK